MKGISSPPITIQQSQAVGSTSNPTTTSTTYIDLAEMSITMITGNNKVLIIFSGSFAQSAIGNSVQIIIDIDGTDKTQSGRDAYPSQGIATAYSMISTSWLETMTAGSHIFKIQWKVAGTTGTAVGIMRSMQVREN